MTNPRCKCGHLQSKHKTKPGPPNKVLKVYCDSQIEFLGPSVKGYQRKNTFRPCRCSGFRIK